MNESTAFDEVMEEGISRGVANGLKSMQRVILRLGRTHLGEPDAATEAALTSIRDLDRLERLADATATAKSWRELLEIS